MDYLSIQEDALIEISRMQRMAGLVRVAPDTMPTDEEVNRAKKLKRESYVRS